jgi:hypothetical protein
LTTTAAPASFSAGRDALRALLRRFAGWRRPAAAADRCRVGGRHRHVIGIARLRPILAHEVRHHRLRQDDGAFQLWSERGNLLGALPRDQHGGAGDVAGGRARPGVGVAEQRQVARLDHLNRQLVERPPPAEGPWLDVNVGEAVRLQPIAGPVDRPFVRGRRRQTRTDVDRQVIEDRRRLRSFHAFRADARQDITIGWRLRRGGREARQRKNGNPVHSCHEKERSPAPQRHCNDAPCNRIGPYPNNWLEHRRGCADNLRLTRSLSDP